MRIRSVTDAAGNATEDIYDAYGNVARKIQTIRDGAGDVQGYLVTVSGTGYFNTQNADAASTGVSLLNTVVSQTSYAPFEITGTDSAGLRYTQDPSTAPQQVVGFYDWNGDENSLLNPDLGKVSAEATLIGPDPSGSGFLYHLTQFSNYTALGKPQTTVTSIVVADAKGNYLNSNQNPAYVGTPSTTTAAYDSAGNLTASTDSNGETTHYWYTGDPTAGVPFSGVDLTGVQAKGLLVYTYKDGVSGPILLSQNSYYPTTDSSSGATAGSLASSTTFNYATSATFGPTSAQTTYSVYDGLGNVVLSYAYKSWSDANGNVVYGWTANGSDFDMGGRTVSTWQATYRDNNPTFQNGRVIPKAMSVSVSPATLATAGSAGSTGTVTVNEPVYGTTSPLATGSTTYTPDGQTRTTTDEYGGVTTDAYDAAGRVVRTLYPDGTEVRSVYDALGRVICQTDHYVTNAVSNGFDNSTPAAATTTDYDSLGRVAATHRYAGVVVGLAADPAAGPVAGLFASGVLNAGTLVSTSSSFYDAQGRAVETVGPSGLATGSVFNPDGTVLYAGTVVTAAATDPAPAGGVPFPDAANLSARRAGYLVDVTGYAYDLTDNLPAGAAATTR